MRISRNIEVINKNAFGGTLSPDRPSVEYKGEEIMGGSADKKQRKNMNLDMEDNWMTESYMDK